MSSTNPSVIVLRHGELFLKGANRSRFEGILERNVRRAVDSVEATNVKTERGQGRLFLSCDATGVSRLAKRLQRVFGITSLSPGLEVEQDPLAINHGALNLVRQHLREHKPKSFRVTAKRSDKTFPITSPQIGRDVGAAIVAETGLAVDLNQPDLIVGVEVGPQRSFVFIDRMPGPGGLPVGASGKVAILLSGGIDSPVAGYLMQKRGCEVHPIYFHSFPYTSERTQDKVEQLARALAQNQREMTLHVVPFTDVQTAIRDGCPAELAVVLYRRMMMRIGCTLARAQGCLGLATGENLGQVASQTLENLAVIEAAADVPVLRPLLTHDKAETIALARRIGSYELSIQPYDDCCSLFVPKHPATRARPKQVERAERSIEIERLSAAAVDGTERVLI